MPDKLTLVTHSGMLAVSLLEGFLMQLPVYRPLFSVERLLDSIRHEFTGPYCSFAIKIACCDSKGHSTIYRFSSNDDPSFRQLLELNQNLSDQESAHV